MSDTQEDKDKLKKKEFDGYAQVAMSQKEIQEKWEAIQTKTFTKWVNSHLMKRNLNIESVLTGFEDGVALLELLEIISEESVGKFDKNPKLRFNKLENVEKALTFIQNHKVKLASIGATAIVDKNKTLTLGMIWTIILRFAIKGLSEEGLSAKQGLLLWCRRKTEPYDNVDVKDFSQSFADGLALCALIHRHRPDLIDYASLNAENPAKNLQLAFDVAYDNLAVPKLLDVEDIVSLPRPDERSMMTYVAQLYNVFSGMDKIETAGRRIGKFLEFAKTTAEWKSDYEARTRKLNSNLESRIQQLTTAPLGSDYNESKSNIKEFLAYKAGERRDLIAEQAELLSLFGNIQSKLKAMDRQPYVPPEGLSPNDIERHMEKLAEAEKARRSALNNNLRNILDQLRKSFANLANALYEKLTQFKLVLAADASGGVAEQLNHMKSKSAELGELAGDLHPIRQAEEACNAANIEENEFTDHTHDDLSFEFEQLAKSFRQKVEFIEKALAEAENRSHVPSEKLKEFQESFTHFDADKDHVLNRLEFKSCLSGLGLISLDFEGGDKVFESIFKRVSGGSDQISFDQYCSYMISVTVDSITQEQLRESFATIAGGKEWVTPADLASAQLAAGHTQFLTSTLPQKEGVENGYDYKSWLASQ